MRILFFGSGGGRVMVYKQIRKTAGFYIELDRKILVDPGVGSYLWFVMNFEDKVKIEDLDYILVSHAHIDHCHDIVPYVDRITIGGKKKRKIKLLASPSVIEGREFGPCIDKKYLSYLDSYDIFDEKKEYQLSEKTKLKVLRNKHTDPWTYSMRIDNGQISIGYISDTSYFDELKTFMEGVDVLIINTLRPLNDKHHYHLTANDAYEIAKHVKPKLLILHHQGFKFLKREIEHLKFFNMRGIRTVLSYEGLEIDLKDFSIRYTLNKPYYYNFLKEIFLIQDLKNVNKKKEYKKPRDKLTKMLEEIRRQFYGDDLKLTQTWIDKDKLRKF
jgi:ribonuclease BN (tRNA processing enzyme)